jgi:hypothetical protein
MNPEPVAIVIISSSSSSSPLFLSSVWKNASYTTVYEQRKSYLLLYWNGWNVYNCGSVKVDFAILFGDGSNNSISASSSSSSTPTTTTNATKHQSIIGIHLAFVVLPPPPLATLSSSSWPSLSLVDHHHTHRFAADDVVRNLFLPRTNKNTM